MKTTTFWALVAAVLGSGMPISSRAQAPAVVPVGGVLAFGSSGKVDIMAKDGSKTIAAAAAKEVAEPSPIEAGGSVRTGTDGATSLLLGRGASMGVARMGPNSEVRIPGANDKGHGLELLKGTLFLHISAKQLKQRGKSEFKLKTPSALLAVKGTQFFAASSNGTDTIGVHEGAVLVLEPSSGASKVITSGAALDVRPGALGAARSLTAAEKTAANTYALAGLATVPLGIFTLKPSVVQTAWFGGRLQDPKQDWAAWRSLNSSITFIEPAGSLPKGCFSQKYTVLEDGVFGVRRSFSNSKGAAVTHNIYAMWDVRSQTTTTSGGNAAALPQIKTLQALAFKLRAANAASIEFNCNPPAIQSEQYAERFNLTQPAETWYDFQLPVGTPEPSKISNLNAAQDPPYLYLRISATSLTQTACVIEMKDFRALFLPQP